MEVLVIEEGWCMCKHAPMGHGGLEGFMEDMDYKYQKVTNPKNREEVWFRVYHTDTTPVFRGMPPLQAYYETCSTGIFQQHFKIYRIDKNQQQLCPTEESQPEKRKSPQ